jgi:hypothetical protein
MRALVAIRYKALGEPAGIVEANLPWGWFALIRPKQDNLFVPDQRPALNRVGKLELGKICFRTSFDNVHCSAMTNSSNRFVALIGTTPEGWNSALSHLGNAHQPDEKWKYRAFVNTLNPSGRFGYFNTGEDGVALSRSYAHVHIKRRFSRCSVESM